jgi:cell filamentation protein
MNNYDNQQSKYCYPGTDTLINKYGIKDDKKLEKVETAHTKHRLSELEQNPLTGSFGVKHLQKIHKYIFQDLYSFAGEFREEGIAKGTTFAAPLFLNQNGKELLNRQLKDEKFLKGLNKDEMSKRLSYYMGELNFLHPFREGNGRAQREFIRTLGLKNGYNLDWTRIDKQTMLNASINSVLDSDAFIPVFKEVITNDEPDRDLIKSYQALSKKIS